MLFAVFAAFAFLPLFASADSDKRTERPSVHMTAEGKALVRMAKVTSISGTTINASVTLGGASMPFSVETDATTRFYNKFGKAGAFADIAVGDSITFGGVLEGNGLTVQAVAVKDFTGAVMNVTLAGKINDLNSTALSFLLDKSKSEHGEDKKVTVQANASTTINLNGVLSAFASLMSGDKVKVTGNLNPEGTVLAAVKIDASRHSSSDNSNFKGFLNSWFKGKEDTSNDD